MLVLGVLFLVCMFAVGVTVLTVFRRWKAASSDADLIDSAAAV